MLEAKNIQEAFQIVNEIFPTDYETDHRATACAGYPVYRSTADGHYYDYICNLGDRLEVNLSTGRTINVWIKSHIARVKQIISETAASWDYNGQY